MKAIYSSVAFLLVLSSLTRAADDKPDPIGTWKCQYMETRTSTLTIKKDGDQLAGTMNWPDQKETKLKDLKLKDGTLTFVAERQYQDNKMTVEYTLTIEGDKLKGKGAAEFGGQKHEWEIKAQREKKEK